jgi:hypothetical protein
MVCLNNVKQMGLGTMLYEQDSGFLPPHRYCTLNGTTDQASRWEYTKNEGSTGPGVHATTTPAPMPISMSPSRVLAMV